MGVPHWILRYDWLSQLRRFGGVRAGSAWLRVLRSVKPDIIHVNAAEHSRAVSVAAWALGIPWIAHCRFPLGPSLVSWVFRRLPKPQAVVFNSNALKAQMESTFSKECPRADQRVVYNGIPLNDFNPATAGTTRRRRVGIVANLSPVKGYDDFLQMAATVTSHDRDVEFVCVGSDVHETGYERKIVSAAKSLGIEDRVRFLGHRNDIPEILCTLDVLVCSSHEESFGRCIVEAMASGLPVVATSVGGIPEVMADGVTGHLVPPRRPDLLADRVSELLANPQQRAEMGAAGRKRAIEMFSAERHASKIMDIYQKVIG